MRDHKSADALRRRMLAVGDQLIAELARESRLTKRSKRDASVPEELKASRKKVERLADEYAEAIQAYRKALERQILPRPARRVRNRRGGRRP